MTTDGELNQAMILPQALDLRAAAQLHRALRRRLAGGGAAMDASAVEIVTLPGAQVILSALRSHPGFSIVRPSTAFEDSFGDLGIDWRAVVYDGPEPPAPVDSALETIASRIGTILTADEPESGPTGATSSAKRILTIDDSKTMRDMLMFTLADAGFEVLQGVDGEDGLDVLGDKAVDVVITDINMPKMDGYEVIRRLRDNPVHKNTPILVLTTESDAEKRSLARAAGATGWMVKPFDPERLLATVRKVSP